MELLTDEEIRRRLDGLDTLPGRRFVKPLRQVGESLIEALRVEDGIGLGLGPVDVLTRGFRPTDLVIITGFAHSGKTQLINTMIWKYTDKRVLFFSLDDPAEMILAKLVAMKSGLSSMLIEQRVRKGEAGATQLVLDTAEKEFPNLFVVDDVIGIPSMQDAVHEATEAWGAPPDAVIIDYVEMMPGNGHSDDQMARVKDKINDLKKWAKVAEFPLIALHQGTRSNANPGKPITILSMGFSGEQQATIVIGVRRKRDDSDLDAWDRQQNEDTITLHVVKNKRPGGRMTHYDGLDFYIDPNTGLISVEKPTLSAAEAVQQSLSVTS